MSLAAALLLAVQAAVAGTPAMGLPGMPPAAAGDPRQPVSLWIGSDEPLYFRFGDAIGSRIAASPNLRRAFPTDEAAYRLVVTDLTRPRGQTGRFVYRIEVRRAPGRNGRQAVMRYAGACTTATIDGCASSVMDRFARWLRG